MSEQIDSHLFYNIVREILWKLRELDFRQESITLMTQFKAQKIRERMALINGRFGPVMLSM
jgi:hypothetical protein